MGFWESGILRKWDLGKVGFWESGNLGSGILGKLNLEKWDLEK